MTIAIRHDPTPVEEPYRGIYAHGVETRPNARQLHISGQVGTDEKGHAANDFTLQCTQAFANLFSVLKSADMKTNDIVSMKFYLTRREDMSQLVKLRKVFLDGVRPAITTVIVAGLVSESWLVEVEAVAVAQSTQT